MKIIDFRDWISRRRRNRIRELIRHYNLHEREYRRYSRTVNTLIQANKMTMLLHREKNKNEAHLQPLRENARKLAFLNEVTKSNDGTFRHDLS